MTPQTLEILLYLKANRRYWTINDVAAVIHGQDFEDEDEDYNPEDDGHDSSDDGEDIESDEDYGDAEEEFE